MYEIWYDYLKPIYGENIRLCYIDKDGFIVHVKTNAIYRDIAEDVEARFDASNYEINRLLSKAKNGKVIGLMKDYLG